jgi:chorismate mutase
MRSVMASKWQSRTPVEDRAQEQAVLAGLDSLRCRPGARASLLRDSRRLIRTRFVTNRARGELVGALLKVHGPTPCRHAS